MLVTLQRGVIAAEELASRVELADRIDIFEIEQFVALNVYELGKFGSDGRKTAVADIVERYNEIFEEFAVGTDRRGFAPLPAGDGRFVDAESLCELLRHLDSTDAPAGEEKSLLSVVSGYVARSFLGKGKL